MDIIHILMSHYILQTKVALHYNIMAITIIIVNIARINHKQLQYGI